MRRLRLEAGLSQEAVAIRMSVDRAHVSSMERGQQNVTLLLLHEAAQAIGVKPATLLEESDTPTPPQETRAPRTRRAVRPRG